MLGRLNDSRQSGSRAMHLNFVVWNDWSSMWSKMAEGKASVKRQNSKKGFVKLENENASSVEGKCGFEIFCTSAYLTQTAPTRTSQNSNSADIDKQQIPSTLLQACSGLKWYSIAKRCLNIPLKLSTNLMEITLFVGHNRAAWSLTIVQVSMETFFFKCWVQTVQMGF